MSPLQQNRRIAVIVLVVLVVALVALIFLYYRRTVRPNPPKLYRPQFPAVMAPKGELTPKFPKELILDDNARLGASFAINYNPNLNQYTANFYSQKKMAVLFADYKSYFKKNNWTLVNEIAKYADSRGLYARNGTSSEASVTIIDPTGGLEDLQRATASSGVDQKIQRLVSVSYIAK